MKKKTRNIAHTFKPPIFDNYEEYNAKMLTPFLRKVSIKKKTRISKWLARLLFSAENFIILE